MTHDLSVCRSKRTHVVSALHALAFLGSSGCTVFEPPLTAESAEMDASTTSPTTDAANGEADAGSGFDERCVGVIKINEVDGATTGSGADREFIEITNDADEFVRVGGLHLARGRGSGPDVGKARAIPDNVELPPRGFLYMVVNVADAQEGLQTDGCIDGAPTPCLHAPWDIDATGDSVFLLNREKTDILCEAEFPDTVPPAQAWGRIPDGSASFEATRPTPGTSNIPAVSASQ